MAGSEIHPSAVVEAGARLGENVRVGPFCHVGADCVLGDDVHLVGHVTISGATTIGKGTQVHPGAVLGGPPQSFRHKGGRTELVIGENCMVRECVTMNVGTDQSRGITRVGNNSSFFAYSHVAHDCIIGNNVILANSATLAGHCEIGDNANLGGLCAVHQFVRIGEFAFIGGMTGVPADVIPFGMMTGVRGNLRGLNVIGMKRSGYGRADILAVRKAYKLIFDPARPVMTNLSELPPDIATHPLVARIVAFIAGAGKRRFVTPPLSGRREADDDDEG
jgi:UDP-N-acetylglucosamine acyltransferase